MWVGSQKQIDVIKYVLNLNHNNEQLGGFTPFCFHLKTPKLLCVCFSFYGLCVHEIGLSSYLLILYYKCNHK